jgi:flagellar hook-associated protein 3 FlgL
MTNPISSANFYGALRMPIQRLQQQLDRTQQAISSGRSSDLGLDIGAGAAAAVGLRNEIGVAQATVEADTIISMRMTATQDALVAISDAAQGLQQQLLQNGASASYPAALRASARATLAQIGSILNTSISGQYVFAGLGGAGKPIADYFSSPASAAHSATDQAFQAAFGFSAGAAGTGQIAGAHMQAFLDESFASLFDTGNWKANWSNAADAPLQSRISPNETIASSVSANDQSIRSLVQGVVMLADLGLDSLGADARSAVVSSATTLIGDSIGGLTKLQVAIGVAQNQTEAASGRAAAQSIWLQGRLDDLEGVDMAKASIELTTLSTELQAAYEATARISQLSILKFI